ncbi:4Fe-4S dicluster domain-containing protein [Desulfobacula toluolica]|uniref:4Fe-4S ferredoxin domain protein n=1 Tax=Desulfobacula toluolica (strain DSM 7467 / Tol2) TaxID=651182 RepID=K0NHB4_DESTT|nr:4Fe-4S dicluster domain-containing protein [Desulfobacula toluolica]CCK80651.1 4Fe-4S ferredoxin domain protein [Desulfobacula toluolica Tol2]
MAHHVNKKIYGNLIDRINRLPQGANPSQLLYQILEILFTKEEAQLISLLPIKPFSVQKASQIWKMNLCKTQIKLDKLCDKALLIDIEQNGKSVYVLPPPMAGFFEFSMMRIRKDIDQKLLSELFYQYLNVEKDFVKNLFTQGETQLGRVFVHEPALSSEVSLQVLDYERASKVIKNATHRAVSMCYCRHKMHHIGKACNNPIDICMTFNISAASLIKHKNARSVDVEECMDLLQQAYDHKLVQFGDNVREQVNFICNCCGCCCEALLAAKRFAIFNPVHTTNFIPEIDDQSCNGCKKCVNICPVEALHLIPKDISGNKQKNIATLNANLCLGCGICIRSCPNNALKLRHRETKILTPLDSMHRVVVMAIERGTLQDFIFDNRVLFSHRAMAAVLGVFFKLPLIKRILANRQLKSRYLEKLTKRIKY